MIDDDVPLLSKIGITILAITLLLLPSIAEESTIIPKNSCMQWNCGYLTPDITIITIRTPELYGVTYYGNGSCVSYTKARTSIKMGGWAGTFLSRAEEEGYGVHTEPIIGAVMVTNDAGGHVAVVEEIIENSIRISEQNYRGPYIVSERTILKDDQSILGYIY